MKDEEGDTSRGSSRMSSKRASTPSNNSKKHHLHSHFLPKNSAVGRHEIVKEKEGERDNKVETSTNCMQNQF